MKRIFIAVMALAFNTVLFSCDKATIAEDESLLEIQATEGDDGDVQQEREDE